jgi:hypothetical protein
MTERHINNNNLDSIEADTHIELAVTTAKWMLAKGLASDIVEAYAQIATPKNLGNFLNEHFSSPEEALQALYYRTDSSIR